MTAAEARQADRLQREAVSIAQRLIRIESVSSADLSQVGTAEAEAARFVASLLEEVGLAPAYFESAPGRGNVVCRIESGSDAPALVVHAHLDVVPAAPEDWTFPPFAGHVEDGYLWGRGAVDLKGFAAMMVAVARDLRRSGQAPARDVVLAFFADEETGGKYGARWMVDHHPEVFAGATEALGEIGGFTVALPGGRRGYLLATAEKGMAWARLRATGSAGHASLPSSANAVSRLASAVARIAEHSFPAVWSESASAFFSAVDEDFDPADPDRTDVQALLSGLGSTGRILDAALRNTASPTVFHGGYKENVIPADATAIVDCRLVPGTETAFRAEFEQLVGDGIEVEWVASLPAVQAPVTGPLVTSIVDAVRAADPDALVVPYLVPAGTDNKHLNDLGIAGYGFTPLSVPPGFDVLGHFHAADERVPVAALESGAALLRQILLDDGDR